MQSRLKSDIVSAKFISLDSSLLGNIARDYLSTGKSNRDKATKFLRALTLNGFVLVISWHHFEELIKHVDREVVSSRITFLRSLPLVGWVTPADNRDGLGSIVDILVAEAKTAIEYPSLSVEGIRNHVQNTLIRVSNGEDAIAPYIDNWEHLRPHIWQQENRAREIVAISRAKLFDVSKEKIDVFINGRIRPLNQAESRNRELQTRLAAEIRTRGDKRIPDADVVASKFYEEVEQENEIFYSGSSRPGLDYLKKLEIEEDEIQSGMLMEEITELAEFRKKLRVAHQYFNIPWIELKRSVTPNRIPSWVIENSLKKHGQDLPERKGSELNDNHLMCLAAYAHVSYVDKRTKENYRRALEKNANLGKIINNIEKASSYDHVQSDLNRLSS